MSKFSSSDEANFSSSYKWISMITAVMPQQGRCDQRAPSDAQRDRRSKCHRRRRRCIRRPSCRDHRRRGFLFCRCLRLAQSSRRTREQRLNLAQELAIQGHGMTSPPPAGLSRSGVERERERQGAKRGGVEFFFFFSMPLLTENLKSLNVSLFSGRSLAPGCTFHSLAFAREIQA